MRSYALVKWDIVREKRQNYIIGEDYFSAELLYSCNIVYAIKTTDNPHVAFILLDEEGAVFLGMRQ